MGKSLKNVVTPDEMCEAYGADTFRVYEMSMGPLEVSRPWETRAVVGVVPVPAAGLAGRWSTSRPARCGWWTTPADEPTRRLLHKTIDGVRDDMDGLRFNTAIAKLIELTNALTRLAAHARARWPSRWC